MKLHHFSPLILVLAAFLTAKISAMPEMPEISNVSPVEKVGPNFCPNTTESLPCSCTSQKVRSSPTFNINYPFFTVWVTCKGPKVTQTVVDLVVNLLKRQKDQYEYENQKQEQIYPIEYGLTISSTDLTEFDLTALLNAQLNMTLVSLNFNQKLSKFVSFPPAPNPNPKIYCVNLMVEGSPLNDQEIGKMLTFFSPDLLMFLEIDKTLVQGPVLNLGGSDQKFPTCPENPIEFLPGLSKFKYLDTLVLSQNKIRELSCGPFAPFEYLRALDLRGNQIEHVGQNGLLFSTTPKIDVKQGQDESNIPESVRAFRKFHPDLQNFLDVYLVNTTLSEQKISKDWGIDKREGNIQFYLPQNNFTTLPEEIFRPFLEKPGNTLNILRNNDLVCDEKLSWISDLPDWNNDQNKDKYRNSTSTKYRRLKVRSKVVGVEPKCWHGISKIQENTTPVM